MRPLYIFDLDGTLALIDHRRPILDDREDPQRWKRFYAACDQDQPNDAVIATMAMIRYAGGDVQIWSGRSDEVRAKTETWLAKHTAFMSFDLHPGRLRMRAANDFTPDEVLKRQWLDDLSADDRARLIAVFDDRDKVVAMWRAAGVACFQVAPGEF